MQEFEGCSLWQLNLQEDLPVHDELIKLGVEFEDHMRIVLYPERFKWSNPQEAVFDWFMSDLFTQFKVWNALDDGWFDSLGLACSSQKDFEQFCILEFGKNVKPMHFSLKDFEDWDHEKNLTPGISKFLEVHANRDLVSRGSETNIKLNDDPLPDPVDPDPLPDDSTDDDPEQPEEEEFNHFLDENFNWDETYTFDFPNWWGPEEEVDWEFLWNNRHRMALLMTPAFSLPHNPRLDDENRESFICSQEPRWDDYYDDPVDCVDCEFKDDMHHLATSLF